MPSPTSLSPDPDTIAAERLAAHLRAGHCCDLEPSYNDGDDTQPPHWTIAVNENDERGREVDLLTFTTEGAALEAIDAALPISDDERSNGPRR